MTESELRTEMFNAPPRREAAVARAVDSSREAAKQDGEPGAAWSMGEKLLNALVFGNSEQLCAFDYSEADAIDRLRHDFGVTAEQFPDLLARIPAQL